VAVAPVRPATPDDLDAVLALQRDWNEVVYDEPRTTREMLAAHWPRGGHWVVEAGAGVIDGYGVVDSGGGFEVWVRPGVAVDSTGRELVQLIAEHHPGRLETVIPAWAPDLPGLLDGLGFQRLTEVLEMAVELRPPLPEPDWPAGVRLRPFDAERDAADAHACLVEAFAGSDERVAPFEEWRPWLLGDPSYDSALVFLAEADGEVAGLAQCWTEGFVKDLAVRPAHRGRGLGEALLRAVFAEFARRGVVRIRLKVDAGNPTGAVRFYRRVGMDELRRYVVYARG
jgi:ribosomal protein S18 acetylase RimI-like enzyme